MQLQDGDSERTGQHVDATDSRSSGSKVHQSSGGTAESATVSASNSQAISITVPAAQADRPDLTAESSWLHDFYKECGREVTLAYTTLNQMKNWAIVIEGSIIAAVVSLSRNTQPGDTTKRAIFLGAAAAYVFVLRFLIRAILCYINLLRWNRLQSSIVSYVLVPKTDASGVAPPQSALQEDLRKNMDLYYHKWLATVKRWDQLLHNLKLGFGLLLGLPLTLIVWGGIVLIADPLVEGVLFTVTGITVLEFYDFAKSPFFDSAEDWERKRERGKPFVDHFPAPPKTHGFVIGLVLVILVGVVIALRPTSSPSSISTGSTMTPASVAPTLAPSSTPATPAVRSSPPPPSKIRAPIPH